MIRPRSTYVSVHEKPLKQVRGALKLREIEEFTKDHARN